MVKRINVDELIKTPTIGECVTISHLINTHTNNIAKKIDNDTCEAICAEMEISIGVTIKPEKLRKWLSLMKHFEEDPNMEEMADYAIVCRLQRAQEAIRGLKDENARLLARLDELENPYCARKHPNDNIDAIAYALEYIQKYEKEDL